MRIQTFSDEGIILSRKNYGEADRILTVYSKNFGKIRVLAKGVRKPKSRKRGHIEVFSLVKFSATKREGLGIVTEAEMLDHFTDLRQDLKKMSVAYYFCELVSKITREDEPNTDIFNNLLLNLERLSGIGSLKKLKEDFVYTVLVLQGFWPDGKKMENIDQVLKDILEREMSTARVGKQIFAVLG